MRERAARELAQEGRSAESVALLQHGFIHLNAHEPGILPCLCRACLAPDKIVTQVGTTTYHRDFVITPRGRTRGRVLFFWIPETLLGERRRVLRSVAASLRARFSASSPGTAP